MTTLHALPTNGADLMDAISHLDGWGSTTASIGGVRDKHRGVFFGMRSWLTRRQLDALYIQSKVAARMVDRVVDDAFRSGWKVTNLVGKGCPTAAEIQDWTGAKGIQLNKAMKRGGKWSRLYGASALCLPVLDNRDPGAPMRTAGALGMFPIKVVPREDVRPNWTDGDFHSPTYLETLDYDIAGIASDTVRVHHSRVIPWEAIDLPPRTLLEGGGDGWGPSILERVFDDLSRDGATATQATAMMYIASLLVVKQPGLWNKIKSQPDEVQKWLAEIRRKLDSLGILAVDENTVVEALSLALDGVDKLSETARNRVASVGDMPREILFNESPNGLRGGELSGPQAIHFQGVDAWREEQAKDKMERILSVLFEVRGCEVESFECEFEPLWTPDEITSSETANKNAQTDKLNFEIGAVTSEEIRQHRIVRKDLGPMEIHSGGDDSEDLDLSGPLDESELEAYSMASNVAAGSVDLAPALEIVRSVAAGEIPRDAGVALLAAGGYKPDLLGSAGITDPAVEAAAASTAPMPMDLTPVRDVGSQVGVPTRTITRMIETGALSYWNFNGKKQVSMAEVMAAAKAHESEPAPAPAPAPVPEA